MSFFILQDSVGYGDLIKAKKDFPNSFARRSWSVHVAFESKKDGQLLTLEAFKDMIDFEQ